MNEDLNEFDEQEDNDEINSVFLLSWDMYGLEYIEEIGQSAITDTLELLKGNQATGAQAINKRLQMILLRARMNTQRHYEIYTVTVAGTMSTESFKEMFNMNPQGMAELVREKGICLHSDRLSKQIVIT